MNTMEITKIVGGVCGALLIYLLINWGAESMYHTGGGHGEGDHASAGYIIEVAQAGTPADAGEAKTIDELLAAADPAKGKKVFSKCKACHKLDDGANGTGPHLFAVVDRAIGNVDGFAYSGAITGLEGNWDAEALNGFITSPKKYAPGTKMGFAGLKKETDRANLISYLMTIK